jgi:hypothetical protein
MRNLILRIVLPISAIAFVPTLAHAGQFDSFSNIPRRSAPVKVSATPAQPVETVDKTSGRYLQSVGKRVADRPLACPGVKRVRH